MIDKNPKNKGKNDIYNKIILKIHFIIYIIFSFILSLFFLSYAFLSYGITIQNISLPSFQAEEVFIKLDKKIIFTAKKIDIKLSNNANNTENPFDLASILYTIPNSYNIFQNINIDEININKLHKITVKYIADSNKPQDNKISISNKDINANISYKIYQNNASITIEELIHKETKISAKGTIYINFKEKTSYSKTIVSLSDSAQLNLYAHSDTKEISFIGHSNIFTDLAPIIKKFNFKKDLYKWIVPYNKAASYQLTKIQGTYSFSDKEKLLNTFVAEAQEINTSYTFKDKLSTIETPDLRLIYHKGILKIIPLHASYKNHKLKKSLITVDLNAKETLIEIDISADIIIDKDIIGIIKAYDTPFPIIQYTGMTDAHLKMFINLKTRKSYSIGEFFIKDSNIAIDGIPYNIKNASLTLNKMNLNIIKANIKYKKIFSANLNGQLDLENIEGDLYFHTKSINLPITKTNNFILLTKHPKITLHLTKDTESFIIPKLKWELNSVKLNTETKEIFMKSKFSPISLIKNLQVNIDNVGTFNTNGFYNASKESGLFDINITNIESTNGNFKISKQKKDIQLKLILTKNISKLSLLSKSTFFINDKPLEIAASKFIFEEGYLDTENTFISYNKEISSYISSHYLLGSTNLNIKGQNSILFNHDTLYIKPSFELYYNYEKGKHYFDLPKYAIHSTINKDNIINIEIRDFKKIAKHSNTLKKFDIKEGKINFTYKNDTLAVDLQLKNFHPLLSKNGKNITDYYFKGIYKDESIRLTINNNIDFFYNQKGKINAKNVDFNFFKILNYIKLIKPNKDDTSLNIVVKTKNCRLSLDNENRKALSDTIDLEIKNQNITAKLIHKNGTVIFNGTDKDFYIVGDGLNDKFMNELFKFFTFKGGEMSFVMHGSLNDLNSAIYIEDSILEDYIVLNNTLAFFNTIPALVTFSVPNYSKKGLKVKEMYSSFHKLGDIVTINDAKIISKEITITAKGTTDIEKENINLLMQFKTDLGSTIKNIPILGYIVFGNDTISTTVKIDGPLKNPIIKSSFVKSVAAAPYHILERAITLPLKALGLIENKKKKLNKKKIQSIK